jgi:hypothetical protein
MRNFANSLASLPLRKWLTSEVVIAPIAFIAVMLVYLPASSFAA